jgi:hypothetical protein
MKQQKPAEKKDTAQSSQKTAYSRQGTGSYITQPKNTPAPAMIHLDTPHTSKEITNHERVHIREEIAHFIPEQISKRAIIRKKKKQYTSTR